MSADRNTALDALCRAGAKYDRRGWVLATAGNLSVRDASDPSAYSITASGLQKGELRAPNDFVRLRQGMVALGSSSLRHSAETAVHDRLYGAMPSIGSIHHVHAPRVTLISRMVGAGSDWNLPRVEYIKALGFWEEGADVRIPVVPNHHDIPTLAEAVVQAAVASDPVPCVLVEGHGVYAWGDSVHAAQRHIEATEFLADLCWEERFRR